MMMNLPEDLTELDHRLAERARLEPPPTLRPRVLAAVRHELRRGPSGFLARHGWGLAAAAAGVLLALNFVLSAANHAAVANTVGPDDAPAVAFESSVFVGLPDDEVRYRLLLVWAGARLTPAPDLGRLSDRLFSPPEAEPWDTP
jgi:hypothetical protein